MQVLTHSIQKLSTNDTSCSPIELANMYNNVKKESLHIPSSTRETVLQSFKNTHINRTQKDSMFQPKVVGNSGTCIPFLHDKQRHGLSFNISQ